MMPDWLAGDMSGEEDVIYPILSLFLCMCVSHSLLSHALVPSLEAALVLFHVINKSMFS